MKSATVSGHFFLVFNAGSHKNNSSPPRSHEMCSSHDRLIHSYLHGATQWQRGEKICFVWFGGGFKSKHNGRGAKDADGMWQWFQARFQTHTSQCTVCGLSSWDAHTHTRILSTTITECVFPQAVLAHFVQCYTSYPYSLSANKFTALLSRCFSLEQKKKNTNKLVKRTKPGYCFYIIPVKTVRTPPFFLTIITTACM